MTPFYMNASGNDMIGFDGVYYFSLSLKPFDWITFRASRHHYCSHYGDEYDDNFDGNPYVDFDITLNLNMSTLVRDDFVFSGRCVSYGDFQSTEPDLGHAVR